MQEEPADAGCRMQVMDDKRSHGILGGRVQAEQQHGLTAVQGRSGQDAAKNKATRPRCRSSADSRSKINGRRIDLG